MYLKFSLISIVIPNYLLATVALEADPNHQSTLKIKSSSQSECQNKLNEIKESFKKRDIIIIDTTDCKWEVSSQANPIYSAEINVFKY